MKSIIAYIILFIVFIIPSLSFGQGTYIEVLDKKTRESVPFAHVLFESINGNYNQYEISDQDGKIANNVPSESKMTITYMGYNTYESTISPGESKKVLLEPTIFGVDEVVVTGQYEPQCIDKSIYKIEVIGAKTIEEKGANNLAELLSGETNIQIKQDGVLGSSMKMQGLTGENVKILIDGIPIIGRMNGDIDLGQIDLGNVDHIEIVEGPMSVIYGTNALAGTINIITKENTRNKFLASANTYYETVGIYNIDFSGSVKKKKNTLSFGGGRKFFDGHSFDEGSRTSTYKPKEQYKVSGDYILNLDKLKLKYSSKLFKEKIVHLDSIKEQETSVTARDQYFYTTRFTNDLSLNAKIGTDKYFEFIGAYSTYSRAKNTYVKDFTTLTQKLVPERNDHDTTTFNSLMLRGFLSKSGKETKLNYQVGFDVSVDDGTGKRIADTLDTRIGDYAGFASTKIQAGSNVSFQLGLRYIYNTMFDAPLIPSVNLKFLLFNRINVRASYGKGFRAPSLKEMYLDFVDANHNIHGNPNLVPETTNSYNFSMKYNMDTLRHNIGLELSGFYNDGKDVIALTVIDPQQLYYKSENIAFRKTQGGRFNIDYRLHPQLTIKAGLSTTGLSEELTLPIITDSTFINNKWEYDYIYNTFWSDFVYNTDFTFNVTYKIIRADLLISAFYKYNGKSSVLYTYYDDKTEEGYIDRYVKDSYHSLDLTLTKKFINNRMTVVLGAKNLLNNTTLGDSTDGGGHTSSSGGGIVGWGRTYFLKVGYKFLK